MPEHCRLPRLTRQSNSTAAPSGQVKQAETHEEQDVIQQNRLESTQRNIRLFYKRTYTHTHRNSGYHDIVQPVVFQNMTVL